MNKKAVEQLADAIRQLRANGFESLSEAAVFFTAATATVNDALYGVTEISLASDLPNSTVSRLVWVLSERGLLEYTSHAKDRRIKLVRARLDALNSMP